jgi:NADPH2 dehydrogenase
MSMPDLLSPLAFAGLKLKNRIVMPPMASSFANPDGSATDKHIEYYRSRSAAGVGLVIVEYAFITPAGRHARGQLGVHDDAMTEGLRRIAEAIRNEGAVSCLQVVHAGSKANPKVLGQPSFGPSEIPNPFVEKVATPTALTPLQIEEIVEAFGEAARRAKEAGFNSVQAHAAHGFLLSQFLSPLTNQRKDLWGGTEENRERLHISVLHEMRRAIGKDMPLFIRLGASDDTEHGLALETSVELAPRLIEAGADLIDVSGGLQGSRPPVDQQGYFAQYAEAIKSVVDVPVITTGGVTEPEFADQLVRSGKADLIGVGRAMLKDPQWATKAIKALA